MFALHGFYADTKEQLQKENEELKTQREELEVRVSALKSQYDGRLSRLERELRDLRGQQERQEQRDEPAEAGPSKVRRSRCFHISSFFSCLINARVTYKEPKINRNKMKKVFFFNEY